MDIMNRKNRVALAAIATAAAAALSTTTYGNVLITQYYEGTSNNKWIELTNIGPTAVSLDGLMLGLWSNASREGYKTSTTPNGAMTLTGTLDAGSSLLIRHGSADTPSYAVPGSITNSTVINFNGDDSVALYTGATFNTANIVDAIGFTASQGADQSFVRISTNPGWNTTIGSSVLDFATVWQSVTLTDVANAVSNTDAYLGYSSLSSSSGGVDNATALTPVNTTVNFGRTMVSTSKSIRLNKVGGMSTTYELNSNGAFPTTTGLAPESDGEFDAPLNVGTTLGDRSVEVALINTATTSAGAGLGSDDPDETITVTATVVQNRQVGDATTVNTPTENSSIIDLGRVLVGTTASGTGLLKTVGDDSENTRITVLGGQSASYSSTGVDIALTSTGDSDTLFDSADSTAVLSGTGTYGSAGSKSHFLTLVSANSTSTSPTVAKALVGEGLAGETVLSGRVFITATALDTKDVSFVEGDGSADSTVLDLGTVQLGDTTTFSLTIYNLLKTAGFTAGAEFYGSSGDAGLSLIAAPASLIEGGASGEFLFEFDSTGYTAGIHTISGTISFINDSTIAGAGEAGIETLSYSATVLVAVPEPASIALLGLGGVALLGRRRRG